MRINSVNVTPTPTVTSNTSSEVRQQVRASETRISSASNSTSTPAIDIEEFDPTPDPEAIKQEDAKNKEIMDKSVEQANAALKIYDRKIERSVHEKTKTVMYVIKDTKTNEVIAEYPPKKIQDMIAKMWELAGLFVDKKA